MTSTEALDLASEYENATGLFSSDWETFLDWIKKEKGEAVLAAFLERVKDSPL